MTIEAGKEPSRVGIDTEGCPHEQDLGWFGERIRLMRRNVLMLVSVGFSLSLLAGCGGDETSTVERRQALDPAARTREIERTLFVDADRERVLYAARGIHYGTVGRFVVSCTRSGVARTAYVLAKSPDTVAAVEGRGASRAVKLLRGEHLQGGARRSGIEQWIVLTGGKPESIRLDASLLVRPEPGHGCEFTMRGTIVVTPT